MGDFHKYISEEDVRGDAPKVNKKRNVCITNNHIHLLFVVSMPIGYNVRKYDLTVCT
jgi:hypothetical protein